MFSWNPPSSLRSGTLVDAHVIVCGAEGQLTVISVIASSVSWLRRRRSADVPSLKIHCNRSPRRRPGTGSTAKGQIPQGSVIFFNFINMKLYAWHFMVFHGIQTRKCTNPNKFYFFLKNSSSSSLRKPSAVGNAVLNGMNVPTHCSVACH